jgi:hypothetical protein
MEIVMGTPPPDKPGAQQNSNAQNRQQAAQKLWKISRAHSHGRADRVTPGTGQRRQSGEEKQAARKAIRLSEKGIAHEKILLIVKTHGGQRQGSPPHTRSGCRKDGGFSAQAEIKKDALFIRANEICLSARQISREEQKARQNLLFWRKAG